MTEDEFDDLREQLKLSGLSRSAINAELTARGLIRTPAWDTTGYWWELTDAVTLAEDR